MMKKNKEEKNSFLSPTILRYMVNFWTIVLYVTIVADFYFKHQLSDFLGPVCAIYIGMLALYTAEKEFERWHDYHIGRHPGEIYVIVWTILVVALLGLEASNPKMYMIPDEVFSTYVVVISILAITKRSKEKYTEKKR